MAAVIPRSRTSFSAKRLKSPPPRRQNKAIRTREYLTPEEVARLIIAVRQTGGRVAERDALLIMMAYRHGLRASELAQHAGIRLILRPGCFTLHAEKTVLPRLTRFAGPNCGRCARGGASRTRWPLTYSPPCAVVR
jgi:integrase